METIKTVEEGNVYCIYEDGNFIGIIKKDMKTRKNIVYNIKEATCNDIADLIISNQKL